MLLAAEEKSARTPSLVRSCLCPGDQSLLVLLGDIGRSMCFLGRNATHSIHNNNNKSTQCPFPSNTGNEHNAIFLLRHPSLPSSKCHARVPAPSSACHCLGWGFGSLCGVGSHSCNPPVPQPPVCAPSLRELLKPTSSGSNSPSLATYQPVSWEVASGVCFSEMQSY